MSQLLVTVDFPASFDAEVGYALVSGRGRLKAKGRAAAALLPKSDTAIVVLPPQALSWHCVQMPKLPRRLSLVKMQSILAGLLEDKLLDDPNELHLALYEPPKDSPDHLPNMTWVAVCHRAWLLDAISRLRDANIPLISIVPLAWPSATSKLHMHGLPQSPWVTLCDAQGVLNIPLQQADVLPKLSADAQISAEPVLTSVLEDSLGYRGEVVKASQRLLNAAKAASDAQLDLAQGYLTLAKKGRWLHRIMTFFGDLASSAAYKPLRMGLALVLLANVLGLNLWAWKQSAELNQKKTQINQLLTQSFPNVKVVVDAPQQMQRELATLKQAQGQVNARDFESIFSRFSSLALTNTAPDAIEFIANEVKIRGPMLSPDLLQSLAPRLPYAGLNVRTEAQSWVISHSEASNTPAANPSAPSAAEAKP